MPAPQPDFYEIDDEISCATPKGMIYGTVIRIVAPGASGAVEVQYEDGRKEVRRANDKAMKILKRARTEQREQHLSDLDEIRRGDIRRGRH